MQKSSRFTVHKIDGHKCHLPQKLDFIDYYVHDGSCIPLQRCVKRFIGVSRKHPESKSIFRSSTQFRAEEARHMTKHACVVHPMSTARLTWETCMIFIYTGHFVLMPLETVSAKTLHKILWSKVFYDALTFIDIIMSFFTGYVDPATKRVILSKHTIAKNYLLGYFMVDLISAIPYNVYIQLTESYHLHVLKYLYAFKLFRLPTYLRYIRRIFSRYDKWGPNAHLLTKALCYFILLWWVTAITMNVFSSSGQWVKVPLTSFNMFYVMLESCLQTTRTFLLVGMFQIPAEQISFVVFFNMCVWIGSLLNIAGLAVVMKFYNKRTTSSKKYEDLTREMLAYMKYKELPHSTCQRIFRYLDYKFQKHMFDENHIIKSVSRHLREKIWMHNCKRMVENVTFFRGMPDNIMAKIVIKLKSEIFLANDIILMAGVPGNSMYFLYTGTVAVYTKTGTEICHLEDGSHFGEIALLAQEPRTASIVAVVECEVFKLNRKDFLEVMDAHPELLEEMLALASERLQKTAAQVEQDQLSIRTHQTDENDS